MKPIVLLLNGIAVLMLVVALALSLPCKCRYENDLPAEELLEILNDRAIAEAFASMGLTPDWEKIYSVRGK